MSSQAPKKPPARPPITIVPVAADQPTRREGGGDGHHPGRDVALAAEQDRRHHDEDGDADEIQAEATRRRGIGQQARPPRDGRPGVEPDQMQASTKPPPKNLPRSPRPRRYSAMFTAQFWSTVTYQTGGSMYQGSCGSWGCSAAPITK